jgi:hypothetical protein
MVMRPASFSRLSCAIRPLAILTNTLTIWASRGSDDNTHLKVLGQNSFSFEDLLASQGSDWDFNDLQLTAQVA